MVATKQTFMPKNKVTPKADEVFSNAELNYATKVITEERETISLDSFYDVIQDSVMCSACSLSRSTNNPEQHDTREILEAVL